MIASLSGKVSHRDDPHLILDVNGVGYKVLVSKDVLSHLSPDRELVKLFIHTHVREDALDLYGFSTLEDLKLFELLISVSGVGPKTAINVFSQSKSREVISAIMTGNVDFFTSIPRLGRKNAQKIIIELKNKIGGTVDIDLSEKEMEENKEVIEALKSFGFTNKEAGDAIASIKDKEKSSKDKIRLALKYLGK